MLVTCKYTYILICFKAYIFCALIYTTYTCEYNETCLNQTPNKSESCVISASNLFPIFKLSNVNTCQIVLDLDRFYCTCTKPGKRVVRHMCARYCTCTKPGKRVVRHTCAR